MVTVPREVRADESDNSDGCGDSQTIGLPDSKDFS